MARKDLVVVGASAGGMEALQALVAALPRDLDASIFVVSHMPPDLRSSVLPRVLTKSGPIPAHHPKDRERIEPGRIYVACPDHHLLLEDGFVRVTKGPKENRFRPAIDPLFRSAAYVYGPRVVGVVLSGGLDDGTAGLWTIKLRGGTAIVQLPEEATHPSMPRSAMENVSVDHCLPAAGIGQLIGLLAREPSAAPARVPEAEDAKTKAEILIAEEEGALEKHIMDFGDLSPLTCPECHGVLARLREGNIERFRCHTGHAFSANTLLASLGEQAEERLWDAIRVLDETILLLNHMGEHLAKGGDQASAQQFFARATETQARRQPLREIVMRPET